MTSLLSAAAGLTVELHDDGYLIFRLRNVTRTTVDALAEAFRDYDLEAHQKGQARRTLVDMTGAGWPTPYAVSRMIQASRATPPGLRESIAVYVGNDSMAIRLLERLLGRLPTSTRQSTRIFSKEEDAIKWLRQRA